MSTILMSIKPEYVDKIFNGSKKYEYRKRLCKDKIDRIIVYSTSPIKKVVGELVIDKVLYDDKNIIWDKTNMYGGICKDKYDNYFKNSNYAIAYSIKKYIIYDKPKLLSEYNISSSPQSYVYIKD